MMKKIGALLLLLLLLAGVSACSERAPGDFPQTEKKASAPALPSTAPVALPQDSVPVVPKPAPVSPAPPLAPATPDLTADFSLLEAYDNDPILWGPGVRRDANDRAEAPVLLQEEYKDFGCSFIGPDKPVLYLTFDAGYENGNTAPILDTLKEKGVPAVFFITGHYLRSAPELVERMLAEGHIVGNHSNNHSNFPAVSLERAAEDVVSLHKALKEATDYDAFLFRFPEGAFSLRSAKLLQELGYHSVFWSFAYNDWDPANQMSPADALAKTTAGLHDGAIFLLHTTGPVNAAILGDLIDAAREKGYTFSAFDLHREVQETKT